MKRVYANELEWQLQEAAGFGDCAKIKKLLSRVIKIPTASALGYACRYGGVDCVGTLLDNGATFADVSYLPSLWYQPDYSLMLLDSCKWQRLFLGSIDLDFNRYFRKTVGSAKRELLSKEERIKIIDLLLKYQETINFNPGYLLYYAILAEDHEIVSALRARNIRLSSHIWDCLFKQHNSTYWRMLNSICCKMKDMYRFVALLEDLCKESNGYKMHCAMAIIYRNDSLYEDVNLMRRLLICFDTADLNKSEIMHEAIRRANVEYFVLFEELGWLKRPRTRDALIDYSMNSNCVEITAWLLNFKDRTADLVEEQIKREKAVERELAASPTSLLMMRKLWGFKIQENGTMHIVSYKGADTEIVVPKRIGKRDVTSIGRNAFSRYFPYNKQIYITSIKLPDGICDLQKEAFAFLEHVESVTIPDTVNRIGECCFLGCDSLKSIRLPGSLKVVSFRSFGSCSCLENVDISPGVEKIESGAFSFCPSLKELYIPDTVSFIEREIVDRHVLLKVHRDSAAHSYAISYGFQYELVESNSAVQSIT